MPDQIRASHILVSTDTRSKEDAKAETEALQKKISGGADFADTAREVSDCPSGSGGGDDVAIADGCDRCERPPQGIKE